MSVIVSNLSKHYGNQKALNNISFEVAQGQIVGLLGPNGAGKSTTMKILTGFIPQTSGIATVCGFNVSTQSIEVKRRIGYLPEHNPLYTELYVKEYLRHVAGFYQLYKPTKRIQEMIDLTGLGTEQHKKIGQLSKGYRQRVGLAQAMIHNPDVLILDEPTSGLDPNQLVEIRGLIKNIGKAKTVILSTHIMQEVELLCNRVVIINKGVLVADEITDKLQQTINGISMLKVTFNKRVELSMLKNIEGVAKVIEDAAPFTWLLESKKQFDIRQTVFQFAVKNDLVILSQQHEENSLENVFRQLTNNSN